MRVLFVDGCIRKEESRTLKLANAFLEELAKECEAKSVELELSSLHLDELDLQYLNKERLDFRNEMLAVGNKDHKQFKYAHEFANADKIIIAAPLFDLDLPAIVKVYIENISVDTITFSSNEDGLYGKCKASDMVFLTTRGGVFGDDGNEVSGKGLKALCGMYDIDRFHCVYADGLDMFGVSAEGILAETIALAKLKAKEIVG